MANRFSSGKRSIAECDRCGIRVKLKDLRNLVIKTKQVAIKVCNECWEPDQPQLQLGMYPVDDPQAVRDPRPDFSGYAQSRSWTATLTNNLGGNFTGGSAVLDNVAISVVPSTTGTLILSFTSQTYEVWQSP